MLEITQVISLSRRDMAIQAQIGDQSGLLIFERGDLVSAAFGALRGEQAFFAMCVAPAQVASPAPMPEVIERNVTQPVSALIFDALLKRDTGLAAATPGGAAPVQRPPTMGPSTLRAPITSSLAPAAPSSPVPPSPVRDPQRTLASLAAAIARPCVVALVRPDGGVVALAQTRQPPTPEAALAHLIQGFVAFARAAQVGQWGAPREARFSASGEQALVRLVGLRPGSPALVVVAPADLEPRQLEASIAVHESELLELAM
jgi:hypothetical protein